MNNWIEWVTQQIEERIAYLEAHPVQSGHHHHHHDHHDDNVVV
jgi:hypothetical protein